MRGGAFLKGKEGRVGFRKKPSLMVKKDGLILETQYFPFICVLSKAKNQRH